MTSTYRSGKAASLLVALSMLGACQTAQQLPSDSVYVPPRSDKEILANPHEVGVARISSTHCYSHDLGKCAIGFAVGVIAVDGKHVPFRLAKREFVELAPGTHNLDIAVRWSNETISATPLQLEAKGGLHYFAYAHEVNNLSELAPANPSRKAEPSETYRSITDGLKVSGFYTLALTLSPILVPASIALLPALMVMADAEENAGLEPSQENVLWMSPSKATSLPFAGCCWVWIQDNFGNVVAGEKFHAPARPEKTQPSGEGKAP